MKCEYCDSKMEERPGFSFCNNPDCVLNQYLSSDKARERRGRMSQALRNMATLNSKKRI
jgi:hypothetical protein